MPLEQFFYALHDNPEKVHRLAEQIAPFFEQTQAIGAGSPAEVLMLGGNYDDSITYPQFFENYIFPALREYAEVLHRRGKFLMTHTDGENQKAFPLYKRAGFDIADSVCPYPMTRCTWKRFAPTLATALRFGAGFPPRCFAPPAPPKTSFAGSINETVERYATKATLSSASATW